MSWSVFVHIKVCGQYLMKSIIKKFGTIIFLTTLCCSIKNKINGGLAHGSWVMDTLICIYEQNVFSQLLYLIFKTRFSISPTNIELGKSIWTQKHLCYSWCSTWLSQMMFCKLKFISCDVKPPLFLIAGIESLSEWNGWSGLVELATGSPSTKRTCSLHRTLV